MIASIGRKNVVAARRKVGEAWKYVKEMESAECVARPRAAAPEAPAAMLGLFLLHKMRYF